MGAGGWFILGIVVGLQIAALVLAAGAIAWHFWPLPRALKKTKPRIVFVNPHYRRVV